MNIRDALLKEHSKKQCNRIVRWVGNDQERFDELFDLFLNDEYRVSQRAAWPVSYCVEEHSNLIQRHFSKLLKNLNKKGIHDAVKRNSIRLLQYVTIPEKFHGQVMDICFRYISCPTEPVAVKVYSITVLQNLARQYPDILNEIKLVIRERWDYETVAFKTRAKRLLT
ncbi:MAG TPA: hypothetical protein VFP97_06900 [Chitinophagaceae bacterium]|nr:hypothetical protein [Chitinophagaceae bacterium]